MNKKKELEEIESKLMSLKENERMVRFKIEEIKGSELELEQNFKEPILKKLGLNYQMNNILILKCYY